MNYRMILYIISRMLGVESLLLMVPAFVAVYYQEDSAVGFFAAAILLLVIAISFGLKKPQNTKFYIKEGFVIVSSAWLLWSLFGSLPFYLSGAIPSYIDAFFETVSGFTTTGSTILTDVEVLPRGLLFWRSFTHWIGGMGVLVLVLAFIPLSNKHSIYLMKAEVPGPTVDKLVPKASKTAKILYGMYILLSVMEVIFLLIGGMSVYDSLVHTFSTAGTGGFSVYNSSIGQYGSVYLEMVITVFMILFGINFNLFYFMILKKFSTVFKNEELRVYLGIIVGATLLIGANILKIYGNPLTALRYAVFQVTAVITTTGFATADFVGWPLFSQYILLFIMVIGACAGSTGGGIKVSRFLILIKTIGKEMKQIMHPRSVNIVRIDKKRVKQEVLDGVYVYFIAHILVFAISLLFITLDQYDFETSLTAVLTTLNTTGPGLGAVGPTGNFSGFSFLSKAVLCFDMLAGRLEIVPFIMLFSPSLWRQKF